MVRFTKQKSLFYKYLLSYLLIFLIPFTTISIIFYSMSTNNLHEEIYRSNISKLEQVRDILDDRIREMRNLALTISNDSRLTSYMLNQPYSSKEGINELTRYQISNSFIDGLFIKYHNDETTYSSKGVSEIDIILSNTYKLQPKASISFKENLEAITSEDIQLYDLETIGEQFSKLISYTYPIPYNSPVNYGIVTFLTNTSTLKKLVGNVLGDFMGSVYVLSEDDGILITNSQKNALSLSDFKDFTYGTTGVIDQKVKNEEYSFVAAHSDLSDWTFVTAMPTAQFYQKMSSMKTTILVMLFIIAILGVGVTIYLSLKQYQPIQKLSQYLKQKTQNSVYLKTKKANEFEKIKQTIEFIYEDSEKLREKINIQQPFVREQFLLELLKDNFTEKTGMEGLSQEIQISFSGNYFFVILIAFNEKISAESIEHREEILNLLSEVSYKNCNGFGTELFQENAVALIVSTQSRLESTRYEFSIQLREHLKDLFKIMPTIGVGKVYEGMNLINRSFIEAAASIEYNRFNDEEDLVYFEDIMDQERNPLWFPIEHQVQFTQSLKRGDQIVAYEALAAIIKNLKMKNISTHMLKCMCFDIINTVLKVISQLSLPINVEDMNKITEFSTLDDLEKKAQKLIVNICANVDKRIENHNNHLRDSILSYIDENYQLHNLSLAIVAEKFELSLSYLSRFIKEQTGSTFTQYVWELRNKAFKKELIETDRPIKDIVSQIGYVDVANFTRKFKQVEGLTPGQYRKRYFNHDQEEEAL